MGWVCGLMSTEMLRLRRVGGGRIYARRSQLLPFPRDSDSSLVRDARRSSGL